MIPQIHTFESDHVLLQCHAWIVTRRDGVKLGFTDHDGPVTVDGVVCEPEAGFETTALETSTGLSVDNAEVMGALRSDQISEEAMTAGLFDNADITAWTLDWSQPDSAKLTFRGTIGEIEKTGAAFKAEVRSLSEALNVPMGRVYQSKCDAVLGDARCGVDLTAGGFKRAGTISNILSGYQVEVDFEGDHPEGWFERGALSFVDASGQDHSLRIKRDDVLGAKRRLTLWASDLGTIGAGAEVQLTAGCDKCLATCRDKFANAVNFQGFPFIPGEDWMTSYPNSTVEMNGGKR